MQAIPVRHRGKVIALLPGRRPPPPAGASASWSASTSRSSTASPACSTRARSPSRAAPRPGGVTPGRRRRPVPRHRCGRPLRQPQRRSSLHRMGVHANAQGQRLSDSGLDDDAVRTAFAARAPVTEELEWGDTSILLQVIPLLEEGTPNGALLLMRDVSELRRRDRLLLEGRHHPGDPPPGEEQPADDRLPVAAPGPPAASPEAKQALEGRTAHPLDRPRPRDAGLRGGQHRPVREDDGPVAGGGGRAHLARPPFRFTVEGDPGDRPAEVATPLAVVLTELLQNAVEHGFPDNGSGATREGSVIVRVVREDDDAVVDVVDNGVGLPPGVLTGDRLRPRPVDRPDAGPERAGRRASR